MHMLNSKIYLVLSEFELGRRYSGRLQVDDSLECIRCSVNLVWAEVLMRREWAMLQQHLRQSRRGVRAGDQNTLQRLCSTALCCR